MAAATQQLAKYGQDGLDYLNQSQLLKKFIIRAYSGGKHSAMTVKSRLNHFGLFVLQEKSKGMVTLDAFIQSITEPYDLLQEYSTYLQMKNTKPNQVRQLVKAAKKFLRVSGVKIDNEDFLELVRLPKQHVPEIEGVEKAQIIELLNACKSMRLKTALMLMAATGCRPLEACAVQLHHVNFEKSTITFPAEFTKTKVERTRPMTEELKKQIQTWLTVKYRPHHNVRQDRKRVYVEPKQEPEDLLLAYWTAGKYTPIPRGIKDSIETEYEQVSDTLQIRRKDGRRVLTFKSLRAFVKTTISDLGYSDYSEWFIGHAGSTYYRKSEKERLKIFKDIEPYLTFLDISGLEAKQADMSSKLEESENRYLSLKHQLDKQQWQTKEILVLFSRYMSIKHGDRAGQGMEDAAEIASRLLELGFRV